MPQLLPVSSAPAPDKSDHPNAGVGHDLVPAWRSLVILVLGIFVWFIFWIKPRPMLPPQAGVVMSLPSYINGYIGTPAEVSEIEHRILPADTEFVRKNYKDYSPSQNNIFCGIVLSGVSQQSIHRPEVCLRGQGWKITNEENIPIQLESGHLLTVHNLTIQRSIKIGDKPVTLTEYNMYWFVGENVTTPSHFRRVFLTSWDRIFHNRAHRWAYVTVSSPITAGLIPKGLDATQTKALLVDFIRHIVPTFQKSEMAASTP